MCSRTQYKHNVRAAAQCVEVSWTSAFLLPRALTDVLFLSLRSFSIERRPTRYDLHVSILQELFVVHLLFSLNLDVSPGFGSEKLGWFGVRGGWPPQYLLHAPFSHALMVYQRKIRQILCSVGTSKPGGSWSSRPESERPLLPSWGPQGPFLPLVPSLFLKIHSSQHRSNELLIHCNHLWPTCPYRTPLQKRKFDLFGLGPVGAAGAAQLEANPFAPAQGPAPASAQATAPGRVLSQPEKLKPDPPVVSRPENQSSESMGSLGSRVVKRGDVAHVCKALDTTPGTCG